MVTVDIKYPTDSGLLTPATGGGKAGAAAPRDPRQDNPEGRLRAFRLLAGLAVARC